MFKNYDYWLEKIKQNGLDIIYVPKKYVNYEICLEACKENERVLTFVSKEVKDKNFYMEVIKDNPSALKYVSIEYRDYDICLEACKRSGRMLEYVFPKHKNYEMCMAAIQNNGGALKYVPRELKDYKMCIEACKNDKNILASALESVPKELIDYEMCLEASKNKLLKDDILEVLKHIPDDFDNNFKENLKVAMENRTLDSFKENYPFYFRTPLENLNDETISINNIIENIKPKHLEDPKVIDGLIERFSRFEVSNDFNLEGIKKYPDLLLQTLKTFDFENEPLIETIIELE